MKAWRDVVPVGMHQMADGAELVTPARAKHWEKSLKAMRKAGNRVPVPWGDIQASAQDEFAFQMASRNAGYIDDAEFDEKRGMLRFLVNIDGAELVNDNIVTEVEYPDGTKSKRPIGEIRLGLANWINGRGKMWNDVVTHAAIAPPTA